DAEAPIPPRTRASDSQFVAGACDERPGAAARGCVEASCQSLTRLSPVAAATQCRAPFDQGPGAFEYRRGLAQHGRGFLQSPQALLPAARQPGDAQSHAKSTPAAEPPNIGKLGLCQLAGTVHIPQREQCLRSTRARVGV